MLYTIHILYIYTIYIYYIHIYDVLYNAYNAHINNRDILKTKKVLGTGSKIELYNPGFRPFFLKIRQQDRKNKIIIKF